MNMNLKVAFFATAVAACSQERPSNRNASARDTARNAAAAHDMSAMPAGPDTAEMAGMDHSQTASGDARSEPMTGMNHSALTARSATSQSMAGMDHSRMNMPSGRPSAASRSATGMQNHNMPMGNQSQPSARDAHAGMAMTPGMAAQPVPPDPHAGMEMEPVDQPAPDDVAMEKLRALVAELVRDPEVLARIQADPTLRALWEDPGVRQYLLKRP